MLIPIVTYNSPILKKPSSPILKIDNILITLVHHMFDTMFHSKGVGLAAPQIGINKNLFIINENPDKTESSNLVFINPTITSLSEETAIEEEGCLSIPKIYGRVKRHRSLTIKATNLQGETFFMEADDFLARIIQHEMDHLLGVLFIEKIIEEDKERVHQELELLLENS